MCGERGHATTDTSPASHRRDGSSEAAAVRQIAELEERAVLFGDPVKQSAQAKVLERKWLRFLLVHGEEYEFVARAGPSWSSTS